VSTPTRSSSPSMSDPTRRSPPRGWTQNSGRFLEEVLIEMSSAGAVAFLVAEAGRDALSDPPNLQILAEALAIVEEPVIAAGGVRDLEDLRKLVSARVQSGRPWAAWSWAVRSPSAVSPSRRRRRYSPEGAHCERPGGVIVTRTPVGVQSLEASLGFYRDVLGFNQVRSPSQGVITAVVEAGPGQHIELVEGGTERPQSLVFSVEEPDRWRDHLSNLGVSTEGDGSRLVVVDPDGLKIILE
jgi:hypothetical protein